MAGRAALLDDVAAIAKTTAANAARTSGKAVGVVVDDTAVTPQFLDGADPSRELPMIWRIAKGSLVNKLLIILPIALILSVFLPWLLTPILMLGGSYLCFEGMEKVSPHTEATPAVDQGKQSEDALVKSAIFTDLILSAEIMVISLSEVAQQPVISRALILIVVGVLLTALVYGVVALLVKMDDIGMHMVRKDHGKGFGRGMVKAMPVVLDVIGVIGTFAMLWVGGHIMVTGLDELGWHAPHELVHHAVAAVPGWASWFAETGGSLVFGALWGLVIVAVVALVKKVLR